MNSRGNLSQCMMDSDPEALARARRLRRKAILISVILEALLLGTTLLWPLITTGVLPPRYILTPLPPYRGGGGGANSSQRTHRGTNRTRPIGRIPQLLFPTASAKNRSRTIPGDAPDVPSGAGDPSGFDFGPVTGPLAPGVPWSNWSGPPVERSHTEAVRRAVRERVSEGVMTGALIHRVEPVYPQIALAMGLSGIVSLRAVIATDGTVQRLEVLSGHPILARAAVEAVSQWRYRPTLLNGKAVEVETYVTVKFVLSR
jgi:periplasmic protein TonB